MKPMGIEVRRINPDDGELLAVVRLAALLDAPSAFGSTHEGESRNSEARWAELAAARSVGQDHCTFFAFDGDRVVGLVGGHRDGAVGEIELVSMWADPNARGRGIGVLLVAAVVDWAADDVVNLWVTRGNDAALRLYGRCGFVETGDHQPLPSDPCKDEIRMRRETVQPTPGD